jgi:hypothetical protein
MATTKGRWLALGGAAAAAAVALATWLAIREPAPVATSGVSAGRPSSW